MEVVMRRVVVVGVVRWAVLLVLLVLLFLLPRVRQRLQKHVLRRDRAESNEASSGSEEKHKHGHVPRLSRLPEIVKGGAVKVRERIFPLKLYIYKADPAPCLRKERDLAWQRISWGSEEASMRWNIGACFCRERNTRQEARHSMRQYCNADSIMQHFAFISFHNIHIDKNVTKRTINTSWAQWK